MRAYLTKIKEDGVGIEGQLTKLEWFTVATHYMELEGHYQLDDRQELRDAEEHLWLWRKRTRKDRASTQLAQGEFLSEKAIDSSTLKQLLACVPLQHVLEHTI